jgi:hypothetical protein
MRKSRVVMSYVFALFSLVLFGTAFRTIWIVSIGYSGVHPYLEQPRFVIISALTMAIPLGMTWWKVLRAEGSADRWGFVASVLLLLLGTPRLRFGWSVYWQYVRSGLWFFMVFGVLGLIVFGGWRRQVARSSVAKNSPEP